MHGEKGGEGVQGWGRGVGGEIFYFKVFPKVGVPVPLGQTWGEEKRNKG